MPKSWVDLIVDATVESETPERFWYWAGLATISAVVRKNVMLDRFYYKLYPNIYVLLMAASGGRKSGPPTLAKRLVAQTQCTRIISGRSSIQSVLKAAGKPCPTADGNVLREAHTFLISGELASFFIEDPQGLTILTDLYDTYANEPEWVNTTKTAGTDTLKNPCFTLLGATNEVHFKDAVPANAVGGGFIGRTIIVHESNRRTVNSLMYKPKVRMPSDEELVDYLKQLNKLKGEFDIEPEAKKLFDDWYSTIPHSNGDRTGTIERLGDTVLKVAMNVALSYNPELIITYAHMEQAIGKVVECLPGLKKITMGAGRSDYAQETALVLRELLERPANQITRKMLLSKYWGEFDAIVLDRVMETLTQNGAVTAAMHGGTTMYTMSSKAVEMYNKFKQELN